MCFPSGIDLSGTPTSEADFEYPHNGKYCTMKNTWATRPLFVCPPLLRKVLGAMAALMLLLLFFSPGIATVGWHLLHGSTIQTGGRAVYVPLGWIAHTTASLGVGMEKLPITLSRGAKFEGIISVDRQHYPTDQNKEEIYRSWETVFWRVVDDGAVVSAPLRDGSGDTEMYCMEASYPKYPSQVTVSCLFQNASWSADFRGQKRDLDTFFEIIRRAD
jgi:hypothetical protein